MSHLLEAPIRREYAAAHDRETLARYLLAQLVVFREMDLLVKAAKFPELAAVKHHEHSRRKRTVQVRQVLEYVIGCIENFVEPAVITQNVRSDAVQLLALRSLDA